MKHSGLIFILILVSFMAQALPLATVDIETQAKTMVDSKVVAGIIVTTIQPDRIETVAFGETALGNGLAPNKNSVFEIASITKVFTGLLLAKAIADGRVRETDYVQDILVEFNVPSGKRKITIEDLATHRSGLPGGFDDEFHPSDDLNPWSDFDKSQLKALLKRTKLSAEPGSNYVYSNIGAGLVGHILEAIYKKSYAEIVREQILAPLEMNDTGITLSPDQKQRLVQGYYSDKNTLLPIPIWENPGIPATGALRSTMADMILFAQAIRVHTRRWLMHFRVQLLIVAMELFQIQDRVYFGS